MFMSPIIWAPIPYGPDEPAIPGTPGMFDMPVAEAAVVATPAWSAGPGEALAVAPARARGPASATTNSKAASVGRPTSIMNFMIRVL